MSEQQPQRRDVALSQLGALGWSVDSLLAALHEFPSTRDPVAYLSGSIGEGLANAASDVDVLLIHDTDEAARPWPSRQVLLVQENSAFNRLPSAGANKAGCQVEHASIPRLERLMDAMAGMLDPADNRITILGYADRRLLHRIKIGHALQRPADAAALQARIVSAGFDEYCLVCNLKEADSFIVDAKAALDTGRHATAARMIQIAASLTASAMLCSIGETNNNPKWSMELLERHTDRFPARRVEALLKGIFIDERALGDAELCSEALSALCDAFVGLVADEPDRLDPQRYRFYSIVSGLK